MCNEIQILNFQVYTSSRNWFFNFFIFFNPFSSRNVFQKIQFCWFQAFCVCEKRRKTIHAWHDKSFTKNFKKEYCCGGRASQFFLHVSSSVFNSVFIFDEVWYENSFQRSLVSSFSYFVCLGSQCFWCNSRTRNKGWTIIQ